MYLLKQLLLINQNKIIFFLITISFCTYSEINYKNFNPTNAFENIKELILISPRDAGTENGHKAARYLNKKLKSINIQNELHYFSDSTPDGIKKMVNVVGKIDGINDEWIIIGSHFDTMPGIKNFVGANDSGSSTGVLLELARVLKNYELNYGIIIIFFDGEEAVRNYIPGDGLHGSRYYANLIKKSGFYKKCKFMILLDMVGDKDLQFTIPGNTSSILLNKFYLSEKKLGYVNKIKHLENTFIIDDHVPFMKIGIPSINIIDFNYGSKKLSNDYWHTSKDNIENISIESLKTTGFITLQLLNELEIYGEKSSK